MICSGRKNRENSVQKYHVWGQIVQYGAAKYTAGGFSSMDEMSLIMYWDNPDTVFYIILLYLHDFVGELCLILNHVIKSMKTVKLFLSCVGAVFFLTQCTDDELLADLNTLSNRVENMEATVNTLNENVTALQVLLQQNKTIKDYSVEDGVYTLTLSDGTEITLTQGSAGEVVIPEISISDDGFWEINGEKKDIKANGNTPQFRISDAGYWEVSYDGQKYEQVKDTVGNPVKATSGEGGGGAANTFFENVEVSGGCLVVTMTGGAVYSLPIVEDLTAEIITEGADFENGIWYVTWGATATTDIRVKGETWYVTAPDGWKASISEPDAEGNAVLSVTAPEQPVTTKAAADNTSDLILQVNRGINWAIDKISVRGSIEANTPLEKFEAGRTIEINGLQINKEKFPSYQHITSNIEGSSVTSGVYFLDAGASITLKGSWNYGYQHLIVIGNEGERAATVKFEYGDADNLICNGSDASDHYFAFSNVTVDHLQTDHRSYMYMNNGDGPFCFAFENCDFELATCMLMTFYASNTPRQCSFDVRNCRFHLTDYCNNIFGDGNGSPDLTGFSIENCVFWSDEVRTVKLLNAESIEARSLSMKNNTFYNVVPIDNDAYLRVNKVKESYTSINNIFYYSGEPAGNLMVFFPVNYGDLDGSLAGEVSGNIGYKDGGEKTWQDVYGGAKPVPEENIEPMVNLVGTAQSPFESVDVENGIFVPKTEYSDAGSSLR